jgi:hypothetical protein
MVALSDRSARPLQSLDELPLEVGVQFPLALSCGHGRTALRVDIAGFCGRRGSKASREGGGGVVRGCPEGKEALLRRREDGLG